MIGEIPEQFCLNTLMSLPFFSLGFMTVHITISELDSWAQPYIEILEASQ